jgi:hypothetical protein
MSEVEERRKFIRRVRRGMLPMEWTGAGEGIERESSKRKKDKGQEWE